MLDSLGSHLLIQTRKRPRILYGVHNTNRAILQSISKSKSKSEIDFCGNYILQLIGSDAFKKALSDARDRGGVHDSKRASPRNHLPHPARAGPGCSGLCSVRSLRTFRRNLLGPGSRRGSARIIRRR